MYYYIIQLPTYSIYREWLTKKTANEFLQMLFSNMLFYYPIVIKAAKS